MSHTRNAIVDTISSVQDTDRKAIPVPEVHDLLKKIKDILNKVVSKWIVNAAHILTFAWILPSSTIMISRLHSFPFVTLLRILFLLVSLAFISSGIYYRSSSYLYLTCHSLLQKLAPSSMFKSGLHWILVINLWPRCHPLILNLRVVSMVGNHLVMDQVVQQNLRRK